MRFGTWNVKSPCRAGSLTTFVRKKYKVDLVKSRGQMGQVAQNEQVFL